MAERRMFAKTIIDSDAFLDMPLSSQVLYFHLAMRADDDGFVNSPRKIMRMIGASDGDAHMLLQKRFILAFDNGVVVIKHWRIHNLIRADRKIDTVYKDQMSSLTIKADGSYTDRPRYDNQLTTNCQPNDNQTTTKQQPNNNQTTAECQHRLGKDSIGKDSIGNEGKSKRFSPPTMEEVQAYCDEKGYSISVEEFFAHYESNGWMVGKNKMKDWRSAVVTWKCNDEKFGAGKSTKNQTKKAYEMVHNYIPEEQLRDTTDLDRLERDLL